MPTGVYNRANAKPNSGMFKKGQQMPKEWIEKTRKANKGKIISERHKQILSLLKRGKNNPNYKDGRTSKKYYCMDCGKRISRNYKAKRCCSCSYKAQIPWNKNKTKKDYPQLSNSGSKKGNIPWNKGLTKETDERVRKSAKSLVGTPSTHSKWTSYKGIWMRSNWEANIARWLDEHNIKWQYEPKRFELKNRTYLPDFYLVDKNLWYEVKGWFHKRHQETICQFRQLYPNENLLVLTKPIYEMILNT